MQNRDTVIIVLFIPQAGSDPRFDHTNPLAALSISFRLLTRVNELSR